MLQHRGHDKSWRWRYLPPLLSKMYSQANAVIGVSSVVAKDLERTLDVPADKIHVTYNPVVDETLIRHASEPVNHPWLTQKKCPVLISVGRMRAQKDYPTLLKAFKAAREQGPLRLIILGDGPERTALEHVAQALGIADDVDMPGYEKNPYPFMAAADALVLSSRWEGLPGVLIEALACGCQIVSTDCHGGSAEVLDHGRYGRLVPMEDPEEMARAIWLALEQPVPVDKILEGSKRFLCRLPPKTTWRLFHGKRTTATQQQTKRPSTLYESLRPRPARISLAAISPNGNHRPIQKWGPTRSIMS